RGGVPGVHLREDAVEPVMVEGDAQDGDGGLGGEPVSIGCRVEDPPDLRLGLTAVLEPDRDVADDPGPGDRIEPLGGLDDQCQGPGFGLETGAWQAFGDLGLGHLGGPRILEEVPGDVLAGGDGKVRLGVGLTIRAQAQSVGGQGQVQRVHGLTLPGRPVGTTNDAGRLTGSVRHRRRSRGGDKRCAEVPRWAHPAADQAGSTPRRLAMRTRADPPMIAARPKKIAAPISTPVRGSIPRPSPANPGPSPPPDEPLPSPPSELPVAPPPAASASCEPVEFSDPFESWDPSESLAPSEPFASDEPSVPPAPEAPFASSEPAESSLPFASSPGSPGTS